MKVLNCKSLLLLVALFTLAGCMSNYKYKIGVSQCVGGPWREKANNEMLSAQHLYDNDVKVIIRNADNSNERQCQQIDSLVDEGVDLLIVSPNDYNVLNKSLQRACDKNIPIVFFDRTTSLQHYAAYIGGDNVEAGRCMAEYAVSLCRDSVRVNGRKPVVLEITGPLELTPDIDRNKGFVGCISRHTDIDYQHCASQWTYDDTHRVMTHWLKAGNIADVVFCHSDLAALAAYDAAKSMGMEKDMYFLGVDALPGKGEGIEAVQQHRLTASYIYILHMARR
ncbi:substrate-binding domain-containing protein [uncultured Prevotella sp.]|uniref:substrate-binding domain-containing protein n=1 Tax=uncultured Prevotella sp. TaxID=159272 RepID=UPI0025D93D55|nr:substrate-binding domain-containing protein [uncultured Prevotella sp.]